MAKTKTYYKCSECGYKSINWMGRCSRCDSWDTFIEYQETSNNKNKQTRKRRTNKPRPLQKQLANQARQRLNTDILEFDRVLGGGIVKGSLILLGGEPGIGKSTLILQVAHKISKANKNILYISGEESSAQIGMRAERLGVFSDNIFIMATTNYDEILKELNNNEYDLVIADSIQTIYDPQYESSPGSVVQIREVTSSFIDYAKNRDVPVVLIGHVTKQGQLAGPKLMEHMVDTVLYLSGENHNNYRLLKSSKNRFGSVEEVGVFTMVSEGLREVVNPSDLFLQERPANSSGSVVVPVSEGNRVILVEAQVLVAGSSYGNPQRIASGLDRGRANLLLAVLEKRLGLNLSDRDVHFNIVGGLNVKEPALDLALAAAIISSYLDVNIPSEMLFFGELGLSGEIRSVPRYEQRLKEAFKMGFNKVVSPAGNLNDNRHQLELEIFPIKDIRDLYQLIKNK
ncbi:MAG: DNA repair protein RadA [Bacillota bacterium]